MECVHLWSGKQSRLQPSIDRIFNSAKNKVKKKIIKNESEKKWKYVEVTHLNL